MNYSIYGNSVKFSDFECSLNRTKPQKGITCVFEIENYNFQEKIRNETEFHLL